MFASYVIGWKGPGEEDRQPEGESVKEGRELKGELDEIDTHRSLTSN